LALREPMNFRRPHADDFSLVEQAVLRGLDVDRLDFMPTAPRENVVPERVRRQQARAMAENVRLADAKTHEGGRRVSGQGSSSSTRTEE
jgi:hypothetical protein